MSDFDARLDQYAELAVRVGLNVQPAQRVFIRATRGEPEFVYRVTRAAYRAGAALVHVLWEEDAVELLRVQNATRENLDLIVDWYAQAYNGAAERGDAILLLHSPDPELFAGIEPDQVAAYRRARLGGMRAMLEAQARNEMQWSVCHVATTAWAARAFPDTLPALRVAELWSAIFSICRVQESDPIAAWQSHIAHLAKRCQALTAKQYRALRFSSAHTDLTVGLPRGHIWTGGASTTRNGITFAANIPTEEVFTLPHCDQTNGHVTMTRPWSVNGVLIHECALWFENGRVTRVHASNAQEILEKLIMTDEGAARLGEVALVPASNPIARWNKIFYDALYDENAASHIALGRAYIFTLQNGEQMSHENFRAAGGNDSIIHEDTMIGSREMNVDGVREDGTREAVMRDGEWAFEV